jgi:hypothetical protein
VTLIGISDHCALAQVNDKIAGDRSLQLIVSTFGPVGGAAPPLVPGTYPVGGVIGVSVAVQVITQDLDATCAKGPATKYEMNQYGTVTITAVSDTEVSGSFALALAGGAYSGSFVAPLCVPLSPSPTPTNQCL